MRTATQDAYTRLGITPELLDYLTLQGEQSELAQLQEAIQAELVRPEIAQTLQLIDKTPLGILFQNLYKRLGNSPTFSLILHTVLTHIQGEAVNSLRDGVSNIADTPMQDQADAYIARGTFVLHFGNFSPDKGYKVNPDDGIVSSSHNRDELMNAMRAVRNETVFDKRVIANIGIRPTDTSKSCGIVMQVPGNLVLDVFRVLRPEQPATKD
ncbi:hypothetical protein JW962_01220 [Candidatus Dojkabacteria bacterium]|nr:hypothetical protein [Candidatus Dojkabacteria bacterium]